MIKAKPKPRTIRWLKGPAMAALVAALPAVALAQSAPDGAPSSPGQKQAPETDLPAGTSAPHDGVIKPPGGIDPEIHKPAPDPNPDPTGKSVIEPHELPGADPKVQPK